MSESTELVRHEMPTMEMARVFSESGFFPSARDAAKACVKILAGRELGLGPVAAMQNIHCFDGKVTLGVHVMAALIKRSGRYDYRVTAATREQCIIEYFDATGGSMGTSSFTIEEAKAAGLTNKDNWKKYPEDMLYSRAMARGARRYCPDVFMGAAYTPEEFIDGEFTAVPATPPPPPPPDVDFDDDDAHHNPEAGEPQDTDTTASMSMPEI